MGFDALIEKVRQAETVLEAKERQANADWRQAKATWRALWTPGRIVLAGVVAGFVVGRAEPFKRAAGGGTLQLISALGGLFAGGNAQAAADQAEAAAQAADAAADDAPVRGQPPGDAVQQRDLDDDRFAYRVHEDMRTPESLRRAGLL